MRNKLIPIILCLGLMTFGSAALAANSCESSLSDGFNADGQFIRWEITEQDLETFKDYQKNNEPYEPWTRALLNDIINRSVAVNLLEIKALEDQKGERFVYTPSIPQMTHQNSISTSTEILNQLNKEIQALNDRALGGFISVVLAHRDFKKILKKEKYKTFFETNMIPSSLSYLTDMHVHYPELSRNCNILGSNGIVSNHDIDGESELLRQAWKNLSFNELQRFADRLQEFKDATDSLYTARCAELIEIQKQLLEKLLFRTADL